MYFYLANVGFEPTPTSTVAPSNTETTVIPTRPLGSLKKARFMLVYTCIEPQGRDKTPLRFIILKSKMLGHFTLLL